LRVCFLFIGQTERQKRLADSAWDRSTSWTRTGNSPNHDVISHLSLYAILGAEASLIIISVLYSDFAVLLRSSADRCQWKRSTVYCLHAGRMKAAACRQLQGDVRIALNACGYFVSVSPCYCRWQCLSIYFWVVKLASTAKSQSQTKPVCVIISNKIIDDHNV
jgi:hypothetical protein